jgi:hypothetical protein
VSGTTFTGAAEANDANSGDTVVCTATRGAFERLLQSPTAGEARSPSGVSGADFYGPLWKLGDPTVPSWVWQNQRGASVVQTNGIVHISAPSTTTNVRSRLIAAPGTPYTMTALLRQRYRVATNTQYAGLVFRESSTGKLYMFYVHAGGILQTVKFSNDTTFSAGPVINVALPGAAGDFHWLRVTDDNTNLRFAVSLDGVNFTEYGTEGRTALIW